MNATQNTNQAQISTTASTASNTERVSAALVSIVSPAGEVVGEGWLLSHPSYLPLNPETGQQAVFSGLLPVGAFTDPSTGEGVKFVGKDGEVRDGGLPVRFYGKDAELLAGGLGEPAANTQMLAVVPTGADVLRLYRGPDNEPRFAVIRLADCVGAAYQEIKLARLW